MGPVEDSTPSFRDTWSLNALLLGMGSIPPKGVGVGRVKSKAPGRAEPGHCIRSQGMGAHRQPERDSMPLLCVHVLNFFGPWKILRKLTVPEES